MFISAAVLLFASALIRPGSTDDQRQKVIDFHLECLDKHGINEQDLHDALDGKNRRDDADFYNHFLCTAIKGKFMTKDGKVEVDDFEVKMKDVILPENMERIAALVRKCLIQREKISDTIQEAVDCFLEQNHGI